MRPTITFRALSWEDCLQLHEWLQLPHIRAFWDDGDRTPEQVHQHYYAEDDVSRFLFFINGETAGYIQLYPINEDHPYANYRLFDAKNVGVDFFIGSEKFLHQGWARPVLKHFIHDFCKAPGRILVDPNYQNKRAVHLYKKAGFFHIASHQEENVNYVIMVFDLE